MEPEAEKPDMEEVIKADGRYPPMAYEFLHEGLNRAVREVHGKKAGPESQKPSEAPRDRHVSGKQLCLALRGLARERWGMLAPLVLGKWNIRSTLDFGNMVYVLVAAKWWGKTQEDSVEDFRDVYEFGEAFGSIDKVEIRQ